MGKTSRRRETKSRRWKRKRTRFVLPYIKLKTELCSKNFRFKQAITSCFSLYHFSVVCSNWLAWLCRCWDGGVQRKRNRSVSQSLLFPVPNENDLRKLNMRNKNLATCVQCELIWCIAFCALDLLCEVLTYLVFFRKPASTCDPWATWCQNFSSRTVRQWKGRSQRPDGKD